jgi:hypothetical protein
VGVVENGISASSQVKLLFINTAFRIVQRATAQSETSFYCDYGVAEAPPGFQAVGLIVCIFLSLFIHFVCSSGYPRHELKYFE